MNRYRKGLTATFMTLLLTGCGAQKSGGGAWVAIFTIPAILLLILAVTETQSYLSYCKRQKRKGRAPAKKIHRRVWLRYGIAGVLLVLSLIVSLSGKKEPVTPPPVQEDPIVQTEPIEQLLPQMSADTDPAKWQIRWEVFDGGVIRPTYRRENPISFDDPSSYFALPGISTFRGDPYRSGASYGTATISDGSLKTLWTQTTGTIKGGHWSGNGWTGQPLIVQWDAATRQNMNLYPEKKSKENLVEVIYASLDGRIYFMDLDDGSLTRDTMDIGLCFKGAGSLDPRGYPLLYVGAGDVNADGERPRMFVISLIDGQILYQYGHEDPLSYRTDNENWSAFDSAPLIHAQTDTLIWPGENGILYTIRLNSSYDKAAGTVSLAPEAPVLTRYLTDRTSPASDWCGYEASPVIVGNYLYISENGGMFFCIDLNTMELVWAQDTCDDSNSTPVFESVEGQEGYLYTAPSLHWTKDKDSRGTVSIYKLDALTGEILWQVPFSVHTVSGVSGGVQASPVLGKKGTDLEGLILYSIARTNTKDSGTLVALDTETGQEQWRVELDHYTWSSPVAIYDQANKGYILQCDANGTAHLIDSQGQVVKTLYLGGLVEASPAVFNNMIVVGTRLRKICGIKIY